MFIIDVVEELFVPVFSCDVNRIGQAPRYFLFLSRIFPHWASRAQSARNTAHCSNFSTKKVYLCKNMDFFPSIEKSIVYMRSCIEISGYTLFVSWHCARVIFDFYYDIRSLAHSEMVLILCLHSPNLHIASRMTENCFYLVCLHNCTFIGHVRNMASVPPKRCTNEMFCDYCTICTAINIKNNNPIYISER